MHTAALPSVMPHSARPRTALNTLAAAVAEAQDQPRDIMARTILEALRAAVTRQDLLSPEQMAGRDDRYTRHCIYDDPDGRFSILALVWKAAQFSPVHGHRTWCAYAVHRGTLQETDYEYDPATGAAHPNGDVDRPRGDAVFSEAGLDDIHRLGNPGGELAISIHIYGVDASRIATDVNWVVRS